MLSHMGELYSPFCESKVQGFLCWMHFCNILGGMTPGPLLVWIGNRMPRNAKGGNTYPFSNYSDSAVEVFE